MPRPIDPAHLPHLDNPLRRLLMPPKRSLRRFGVGEGDAVIDFGAGSGYFALPASELVGDRGFVYALDIAPEAIAIIERKLAATGRKNVRPILTSGGGWGLASEAATIALMITVLHEVEDKAEVLGRLYESLKPGGRIAILEFSARAFFGPPPSERIPAPELLALLGKAGFSDMKADRWGPLFYFVSARK